MLDDSQLLPISALQHLLFCERQCALIHIEGLWSENRLTAEGRVLHNRAHDGPPESRNGVHTARGLELKSERLGLYGRSDVVEFRITDAGLAQPFPIEYKRGKPKASDIDRVQLCAQALCLEEMLHTSIPAGSIFYGRTRRRTDVVFDSTLRQTTEQAALRLHQLIEVGTTPPAQRQPKCDHCSLLHLCLPDALRPRATAARYLQQTTLQLLSE